MSGGLGRTRGRGRGSAAVVLVLAVAGCQETPPEAWAQGAPSPQIAEVQRQLASPFVVFAKPALELARLGVPEDAPVTVGSRPSPEVMWSDAPGVVSVEPDGRLLAHREGQARITARNGGPSLGVVVLVALASSRPAEVAVGSAEPGQAKAGARAAGQRSRSSVEVTP